MARRLFRFTDPERFVAGTIGPPGERTFYLQARQGNAVVSLVVEKLQVAALAARMAEVIAAVDAETPTGAHGTDDRPLDEPLAEAFRVGVLALAWDPEAARLVIEAQPVSDDGEYVEAADDDPAAPDLFRVSLPVAPARDFIRRATDLLAAGRPACPFCGEPLDERGHMCSRSDPLLN